VDIFKTALKRLGALRIPLLNSILTIPAKFRVEIAQTGLAIVRRNIRLFGNSPNVVSVSPK
jgi:hypothetical protein